MARNLAHRRDGTGTLFSAVLGSPETRWTLAWFSPGAVWPAPSASGHITTLGGHVLQELKCREKLNVPWTKGAHGGRAGAAGNARRAVPGSGAGRREGAGGGGGGHSAPRARRSPPYGKQEETHTAFPRSHLPTFRRAAPGGCAPRARS